MKSVNYINNLTEFVEKYKIELVGNYDVVKKTTMIHYKCGHCGIPLKKSYMCLTRTEHPWVDHCSKCFRDAVH